jgi:hypothetical protein
MGLLPKGLNAVKMGATQVSVDRRGASVNRDGGVESKHKRTVLFNAGMLPTITEHPRHRKTPKRGRKRLFNEAIQA